MNERITGYILLSVGLLVMFGALIQVLLVFTGRTAPLPVFSMEAPKLSLSSLMPQLPTGSLPLPAGTDQSLELIPTADFNKTINMSVTLFLMGFVLSFGFKIASLGVMMLRPVVVKLNGKSEIPPTA